MDVKGEKMSRSIVVSTLLLFILLGVCALAYGEPTHKASGAGVEVVVYSESCTLKEVTNLPKRATWTENGKTVEGCGGVTQGLAVFYWLDRTVTVTPASVFVRVIGA